MSSNILAKALVMASVLFSSLFSPWQICRGDESVDPYREVRCARDIKQAEYSGWPMKNEIRQICHVNKDYTWLREQLLRRLPDGSLFCAFFAGGSYDGHIKNMVVAIRSDDDGKTWSDIEVVRSRENQGCWAPSMYVHKNRAHIFWFTKATGWNNMREAKKPSRTVTAFLFSGYGSRESLFSAAVGP
jgi:hypothetical protein